MNTNNKYFKEFKQEGTILLKNIIETDQFFNIDTLLKKKFRKFSIDDPYSEDCAKFAIQNSKEISKIYDEIRDCDEAIKLARIDKIKKIVHYLIGKDAKFYSKIPLRIDVPMEVKELATWHQDDYYVQGAPNEVTAWIPLQDTPMHIGALSVIKKSHLNGKIPHKIRWGKKIMPANVYDLPINIIEMKRGDALFFNSFLLHTGNINFSNFIRYSIQIRFTSKNLGRPSKIMGELYEL